MNGPVPRPYPVPMSRDLTFTLPATGWELVTLFLSLSEGAQRLLLAAMTLEVEGQQNPQVARLLGVLREDEQTRDLVARLESTAFVEHPRSKARCRKLR